MNRRSKARATDIRRTELDEPGGLDTPRYPRDRRCRSVMKASPFAPISPFGQSETAVRELNRAALAGYGSHHRAKVFDARQLPPARLVDVRFAAEKRRLGRLAHGWAGRKLRPARERSCDEVITRAVGIPQRQEQAADRIQKLGMTDAVVVDSFAYAVRASRQRASAR